MGVVPSSSFFLPSAVGKQNQILLIQTEAQLGLQIGVEVDNKSIRCSGTLKV